MTQLALDLAKPRTRTFRPGSQCARILEWLRSGKTITPLQAMQMFNCYVLHSRIAELRAAGRGRVMTSSAEELSGLGEARQGKAGL